MLSQQEKYTATLTSRTSEIERLMLLVEKLQRMLFGRKSEKGLRQIEQLELQLEELQAANAIEERAAAAPVARPIATKPFRRPLPEHLPREIYAREGVDLDRSTLAGWVGATSELLAPLVEAVRAHVMSASKLHADDTPVPVLAPGNGKTRIGRLWTYVRDDRSSGDTSAPAVWFAYSPDRKGELPQQHLKHYKTGYATQKPQEFRSG